MMDAYAEYRRWYGQQWRTDRSQIPGYRAQWSAGDAARAIELRAMGASYREIASRIGGRTAKAVKRRLQRVAV